MRVQKFVLIFLIMLTAFIAQTRVPLLAQMNDTTSEKTGTAINSFAFDLYRQVRDRKGNLFFSPYSISAALAMTYAGARGNTQIQMRDVLRYNDSIHQEFAEIQRQVKESQALKGMELLVANALWMEKEYTFLTSFLDLVENKYDASFRTMDFKHAYEQARQEINRWVEQTTHGRIKDLIGAGCIDSLTRLVVTNAIYFNGIWESRFDKKRTRDLPFFVSSNESVDVPMMGIKERFHYLSEETFQMLALPYVGNDLAMLVLLPRNIDGLPELEEILTVNNLESWTGRLQEKEVSVFLPRFRAGTEYALSETLNAMGMKDAFDRNADFSGIDGTKMLYIAEVFHKAFIEVHEEGTEAAAATAVHMRLGSASPTPPITFRADHPFVFLIMHRPSGSILFLGRITMVSHLEL